MQKVAHFLLQGEIEVLSGMRIGGSDDVLQIGGTDLTCIKDPATGRVYIPGSSLKGRMRSCLEKRHGKTNHEKPCGCARNDCPICRVFGPHMKPDHQLGPTRIIVRDAPVIGEFTIENKTESIIRRDTGAAQHPRTVERVAPGARFQWEIAIQVFDEDNSFSYKDPDGKDLRGEDALIEVVDDALWEMEQIGIGAGTSKGYGKFKLHWDRGCTRCRRPRREKYIKEDSCIEPSNAS
jgi:CRISPR-associated protein Csm3